MKNENWTPLFSIRSPIGDDEVRDKRIGNAKSFSSYIPGKDNPRRKWKMNSTFSQSDL